MWLTYFKNILYRFENSIKEKSNSYLVQRHKTQELDKTSSANFLNWCYLSAFILVAFSSCDPAEIAIDLPEDGVTFLVSGQVDGQEIDMSENVVLYTHSSVDNDTRVYGGSLYSECQNLNILDCQRSFSITFKDSLSGPLGQDGIPTMLQSGKKELITDDGTNTASGSICMTPTVNDSVYINGQFVPPFTSYCLTDLQDYFTPIELNSIRSLQNPGIDNITSYTTQVMARFDGSSLEYYYFSFDCLLDSAGVWMRINLGGNSNYELSDFDFFDLGGGGFNPNIAIYRPLPIYDLLNINFSIRNKYTGDVSYLGLFSFFSGPSISPFDCTFPIDIFDGSVAPTKDEGVVLVEYTDDTGEVYSSIGTNSIDQSFIINSTLPYLRDESGNETVTSSISFNGKLMSASGRIINCQNLELTFGFGYPAQ